MARSEGYAAQIRCRCRLHAEFMRGRVSEPAMVETTTPFVVPDAPSGFRITRTLAIGRHPILTVFPGLERLVTAEHLEGDPKKRADLFRGTQVELVGDDVWMYVAPWEIPSTARGRWNPVVTPGPIASWSVWAISAKVRPLPCSWTSSTSSATSCNDTRGLNCSVEAKATFAVLPRWRPIGSSLTKPARSEYRTAFSVTTFGSSGSMTGNSRNFSRP